MLKLRAPGSPWYTAFILMLFAGLLVYGFAKGDPITFLILTVLLIFFGLPLLLVFILNRASLKSSSERGKGAATGELFSALEDDPLLLDERDSPDHNN